MWTQNTWFEIIQSEKKESSRHLWETIKGNNICTMAVLQRGEMILWVKDSDYYYFFLNSGWKLLISWEKYRHLGTWGSEVLRQVQSKEDFTKMHYNYTAKNQRQKEFWK